MVVQKSIVQMMMEILAGMMMIAIAYLKQVKKMTMVRPKKGLEITIVFRRQ